MPKSDAGSHPSGSAFSPEEGLIKSDDLKDRGVDVAPPNPRREWTPHHARTGRRIDPLEGSRPAPALAASGDRVFPRRPAPLRPDRRPPGQPTARAAGRLHHGRRRVVIRRRLAGLDVPRRSRIIPLGRPTLQSRRLEAPVRAPGLLSEAGLEPLLLGLCRWRDRRHVCFRGGPGTLPEPGPDRARHGGDRRRGRRHRARQWSRRKTASARFSTHCLASSGACTERDTATKRPFAGRPEHPSRGGFPGPTEMVGPGRRGVRPRSGCGRGPSSGGGSRAATTPGVG